MLGLCTIKKYNDLKKEYDQKIREVNELTQEITKKVADLGVQSDQLIKQLEELHKKVDLIESYLSTNGRKRSVNGVQQSDFDLFINNVIEGNAEKPRKEKFVKSSQNPKNDRKNHKAK